MPSCGSKRDWKAISRRREQYRQKLIIKGVVDGGSKMMKLLSRFK
jgi:hypothetical protein